MKKNRIFYKYLDIKKRRYFTKNSLVNILMTFPGINYFIKNNPIVSIKIKFSKKLFVKGKLKAGTIITLTVIKNKLKGELYELG